MTSREDEVRCSSPSGFVTTLKYIHHAIVDDGEITFFKLGAKGMPRFTLSCVNEDNWREALSECDWTRVLLDTWEEVKKSKPDAKDIEFIRLNCIPVEFIGLYVED